MDVRLFPDPNRPAPPGDLAQELLDLLNSGQKDAARAAIQFFSLIDWAKVNRRLPYSGAWIDYKRAAPGAQMVPSGSMIMQQRSNHRLYYTFLRPVAVGSPVATSEMRVVLAVNGTLPQDEQVRRALERHNNM